MSKQEIIDHLTLNYNAFIDYINSLTPEENTFCNGQKWSAAQQLDHIVLCVKPLVQVFSMDKAAISQTFGTTERRSRSYDVLLDEYHVKLKEGGKAPERFVPAASTTDQKQAQCAMLAKLVKDLCAKVDTFTDTELDTLLIPHPLLGNLALREMLYNTIYHVQHHQSQIQEHLVKM